MVNPGGAGVAVMMLGQGGPVKVYVAMRPVDFRKGIDGLALAVQEMFGRDAFSGAVFVSPRPTSCSSQFPRVFCCVTPRRAALKNAAMQQISMPTSDKGPYEPLHDDRGVKLSKKHGSRLRTASQARGSVGGLPVGREGRLLEPQGWAFCMPSQSSAARKD